MESLSTNIQKPNYYSLKHMVFFTYSSENLTKKDKVRFFYALNGRNNKPGILMRFNSIHFGVTSILVPKKFKEAFITFFRKWNVAYEMRDMLVENE